jgi:hypothetical protein
MPMVFLEDELMLDALQLLLIKLVPLTLGQILIKAATSVEVRLLMIVISASVKVALAEITPPVIRSLRFDMRSSSANWCEDCETLRERRRWQQRQFRPAK